MGSKSVLLRGCEVNCSVKHLGGEKGAARRDQTPHPNGSGWFSLLMLLILLLMLLILLL